MLLILLSIALVNATSHYERAIQLLDTSLPEEKEGQPIWKFIFDTLFETKILNEQQTFDWRSYIDKEDEEKPEKARAMELLRDCADSDSRCAMKFADISLYGLYGIAQNATDAFEYYLKLSDAGNPVAHRQIGTMYASGVGGTRDYAKALVYMSFASLGGDLLADQTLAYWHFAGIGMPKSCSNAFWHYKRVADYISDKFKAGPPGGTKLPPPALKLDELQGGLFGKGASGSGNPQIHSQDHGVRESDMLLLYRLQAEAGDPAAQYLLGFYHYFGSETIAIDFKKALSYFRSAAKQYPSSSGQEDDSPTRSERNQAAIAASSAAGYLGQMYWRGEGVEANVEKARQWFERGASQNNPASFTFLGLMHREGVAGFEKNEAKAIEYFKEGAKLENSLGRLLLAEHLLKQPFVNYEYILKLLEDAAMKGYVPSYYLLGNLYSTGFQGVKPSCKSAVTYLRSYIDRAHWHDDDMLKASLAYKRGELQSAFTYYMMAAERGYVAAQVNAALMLDDKIAPEEPSFLFNNTEIWNPIKFALPLYLRAANQGHVDSRVKVGDYYFYGHQPENGTANENVQLSIAHKIAKYFHPDVKASPQYEKAVAHYSAAAEGDYSLSSVAMFNLGFMYEYGMGVEQDYHLAKRWYDLSVTTNPGAYLPVQICLTILNIKWFFNDLIGYFDPGQHVDSHPPIPLDEDEVEESNDSNMETILILLVCAFAGVLLYTRQRIAYQVTHQQPIEQPVIADDPQREIDERAAEVEPLLEAEN